MTARHHELCASIRTPSDILEGITKPCNCAGQRVRRDEPLPTVMVLEFTVESTDRKEVEAFVFEAREQIAKLQNRIRFRQTVAVSESVDDISYEHHRR